MTTHTDFQGTSSDQRFRGMQRLRSSNEIARVFAKKHTAAGDSMVVHLSDNGLAWSRLGVITSKRVGNAVRRNAVRRRIREAFRKNQPTLPKGFDIVCVARPGADDARGDLADTFLTLTARAARKAERRRRR